MTIEELVKDICKWVVDNSERESGFLSPYARHTLDSYYLIEHIRHVTGIEREVVEGWVNGYADARDTRRS
jgi:hypothetical protein